VRSVGAAARSASLPGAILSLLIRATEGPNEAWQLLAGPDRRRASQA
jgi:hypothetical protein